MSMALFTASGLNFALGRSLSLCSGPKSSHSLMPRTWHDRTSLEGCM
jgi:hypothetical protein